MALSARIPYAGMDFTIHDYIPGQPIPTLIKDPGNGRVFINPLKQWVHPFWLVTEPAVLTLAAEAVTDLIPMPLDNKGHFEIVDAFYQSSQAAGFTVELFIPGNVQASITPALRPFLMNREIHVSTFASGGGTTPAYETITGGNAGRPYRWPETYFLNMDDGAKCIFARFRNLSTSENVIRFALHGLRWNHIQAPTKVADRIQAIQRGRAPSFPFFYTTDALVELLASATTEFTIRFDDVSWTEVFKMSRVSTGRFTVLISESATGKRLMGGENATTAEIGIPIRDDLVFGDGEFPFLMWESNLFEPNYKLTFELTDLTGSQNDIWLTLATRKIMYDPKDSRLLRPSEASGRM